MNKQGEKKSRTGSTIAAAMVLTAFVVAIVYFLIPESDGGQGHDEHREDLERRSQAFAAASASPPGATPCEGLWNYTRTLQDKSLELGLVPPFESLPDRATFIQACDELPQDVKQCLERGAAKRDPAGCRPAMEDLWEDNPRGLGRLFRKAGSTPSTSSR